MSTKEATGTKKDKSFNGSKAKYSPNPPVPDKKEVKLRRKESEKLKPASEPARKSVLGRFFHNLVDSDDSRKKNASADEKKKKRTDLDLPEHGIILRTTQTLQRTDEAIPSARLRASTLSNQGQGRDNRNRWSSYDIHSTNFMEGNLPPPAIHLDSATLGHRSQSDETLNTPLIVDQNASKFAQNIDVSNHSDANRQPDVMRKHAQLLKTIQEQHASKATRSEKMYELQGGQANNGWLISGDAVASGQGKNTDATGVKNSDHKSNVLKNVCSDVVATGDASMKSESENSASLVLLQEKSKEIEKALANKRRILSNLFKTPEEDMELLIEKDVELSKDMTVRRMILISLLQSDRLTSVINNSLVPRKNAPPDGAVDKEASRQKGNTSSNEQMTYDLLNIQSLQTTTVRLYQHLKLLKEMVNHEVDENGRLRKELEETQDCLKKKRYANNLSETRSTEGCDELIIPQEIANASFELNASTEIPGVDADKLSKELELKLDAKDSIVPDEPVEVETGSSGASLNGAGLVGSEDAADVEHPSVNREDLERDKDSLDCSDSILLLPCVKTHVDTDVCIQQDNDKGAEEEEEEDCVSDLKTESTILSTAVQSDAGFESEANGLNNITFSEDSDFKFRQDNKADPDSFVDSAPNVHDEETSDASQSDVNMIFRNLESIPEDDDKLNACNTEQKTVVFNDDSNDDTVPISTEHSGDEDSVLSLDVDSDKLSNAEGSRSNVKTDIHSEERNFSQSNIKADTSLNCRGDDGLRSGVVTEDHSTAEDGAKSSADGAKSNADGAKSSADGTVCGVDNRTGSYPDAALPEVQIDGSILDGGHMTSFDVTNADNLLDLSIKLAEITTEKEIEKSVEGDILKIDQRVDEEVEADLNFESEIKKEATRLENVASFSNSESHGVVEPGSLPDIEVNLESVGETLLMPKAESDIELHETVMTECEMTKMEFSTGGLVIEHSNLNIIPENKDQTQLNNDSLFVGVLEDQNGNQNAKPSCKLLDKDQTEDHNENETVEIDGTDGHSDADGISDPSKCDRMEASVLKE